MKKGFTLLEITIVIAVIAVLMTMIINFGANRVDYLQSNVSKNNFVSTIETVYSNVLSSNYYGDQIIDELSLNINKEENYISISYNGISYDETLNGTEINTLTLDHEEVEKITLKFRPYAIGCEISSNFDTGKQLDIQLNNNYCVQINSNNCKVLDVECEDLQS